MTKRMTFSPFDGLKGARGSGCQGICDRRRVSTTQLGTHGEDGKVWKPPKDVRDFLSFGILFECQMMDSRVSHREVNALDIIAESKIRVAVRRITKSVPSSSNPARGAEKNCAVQQRGRELVPSLGDENDVAFGDKRARDFGAHSVVGRTMWQIEG